MKNTIEDMDGEDQLQIKLKIKNWKKKIQKFKLDPTLKWEFAEILKINEKEVEFKLLNKKKKYLY